MSEAHKLWNLHRTFPPVATLEHGRPSWSPSSWVTAADPQTRTVGLKKNRGVAYTAMTGAGAPGSGGLYFDPRFDADQAIRATGPLSAAYPNNARQENIAMIHEYGAWSNAQRASVFGETANAASFHDMDSSKGPSTFVHAVAGTDRVGGLRSALSRTNNQVTPSRFWSLR